MLFKRLFGSKPEAKTTEAKTTRQMTFSQIRESLSAELDRYETTALKNSVNLRDALLRDLGILKSVLNALAAAEVPEPRAVASKTIKDGFTQRALAALERAKIPEWTSVRSVLASLSEIERTLGSVSVGPREAMHLQFFFEQQLAELASQLRLTFETIARVRDRLGIAAERRNKLERIFDEIESLLSRIERKHSEIEQAEADAKSAKGDIAGVDMQDTSELERLRKELAQAKQALACIDQHVVSAIGPAMRLLKRFGHVSNDKRMMSLISGMEASPAEVFYDNSELVKAVLAGAIAAAKSGQISAEDKEFRRAEDVLGRFDRLLELQERRGEMLARVASLDAAIDAEAAKERENAKAAERIRSLENAVAEAEMRAIRLRQEVADGEQRLAVLKRQLEAETAAVLGVAVEISLDSALAANRS